MAWPPVAITACYLNIDVADPLALPLFWPAGLAEASQVWIVFFCTCCNQWSYSVRLPQRDWHVKILLRGLPADCSARLAVSGSREGR
jgi:hypothetical protein